ncbi:nitrite reductase [Photobacterium gaetbulicola]|uniref:Phage shock protein B n=1 Tax=Photobacterium gaetbulicola Gung47 TaxID=658445 RepID=A0A0C5X190_9GAMM|nr:hypothetical protein [Photobacterium gaetbulicola]AJR09095.1 hypothetical protein H744_2c2439 [Photobacterium gaetbulicola Gung47]PSU00460.1 nitrite reductase [Photobacterium gaetbulicola]
MDIVIVIFVAIFGTEVIRRLLSHRERMHKMELEQQGRAGVVAQQKLEADVIELKKRVEVLEKLVTDEAYQLENEIKAL